MRKRAGHWSVAMATAVIAATVAGVALGVFALAIGRASTDDVRVAVDELRARTAEATLLAERAGARELTAPFVRSQAQQLAKQVDGLVSELADYVQKLPSPASRESATLAPEVLLLMQRIGDQAGDPGAVASLAAPLGERSKRLDALGKALAQAR